MQIHNNNNYSHHSLLIDADKCTGKLHCVRACPTNAIRVRNSKARIIADRCIDCGECISVCTQKAILPLTNSFTDLARFKYTVAIPSPAIYGQFPKDILPAKIQKGLVKLGFNEVIDISDMCEATSLAIAEFLKDYKGPLPLITTVCPTVVRLVQSKYPELVDNLLNIESPREIVARETRVKRAKELNLNPQDIGIIYITPCPSKMIAIIERQEYGQSSLDGAISIKDIYGPLHQIMTGMKIDNDVDLLSKMSSYGLSWAMLGGVARPLQPENWLGVSGIHDIKKIFSDIESRNIGEVELIECFSCVGGCVGGSLTVDNMYLSRSKIINLAKRADKKKRWNSKKISKLFKEGFFLKEKKFSPKPSKPLDSDISKAIEKMNAKEALTKELPGIDCGACGSPNCRSFAEDVVLGYAKLEDCFAKREELQRKKKEKNFKIVKD